MPAAQQSPPADGATGETPVKVRRFVPEPIEQSTKSSKHQRSQSPEKRETQKPRRFAPQVVEQSAKSSRQNSDGASTVAKDAKTPARRFLPQPVETSHTSSKDRANKTGHVKFRPEPVETVHRTNRAEPVAAPQPSRKFSPVLIDSAKRSRKAGESSVSSTSGARDYHTEQGHLLHAREHRRHITGNRTPLEADMPTPRPTAHDVASHHIDFADIPRRPVSPLDGSAPARSAVLAPARSHSFRCPDLDTIESSESERGSNSSSRSCSPGQGSPNTASDSSFTDFYKHATRIRESVDENFSHYLLQLEAKKAEQRMREQALAAFPNSDYHEPVQHYVNDDNESDEFEYEDRVVTWEGFDEDELLTLARRRESTKVPWEQLEMQRHAERMEKDRAANGGTAVRENSRSPWWQPTHDPDSELRSMRDRARPPMLGRDLVFPRCPSPEPARFDVTQGSSALRKQMSSRGGSNESQKAAGAGGVSLWSAAAGPAKKSSGDKRVGLWGGFCAKDAAAPPSALPSGLAPPSGHTGLMTPACEPQSFNPFEKSFAAGPVQRLALGGGLNSGDALPSGMIATPPTPPADPPTFPSSRSAPPTHAGTLPGIDSVLTTDHALTEAYPDSFITQVFNYLSLGYPSLARPFDAELSKISRVPLADLRRDDAKARASKRGYIRLGPDFEGGGGGGGSSEADDLKAEECMRWRALKLYIHEWARQEKDMVQSPEENGGGAGGGTASGGHLGAIIERRGSWGL